MKDSLAFTFGDVKLLTVHPSFKTMSESSPRIPDSVDIQRLHAMQFVAKMKESADRIGVGFVGGFISPNGEKFMMTNMDEADTNMLLPDELK